MSLFYGWMDGSLNQVLKKPILIRENFFLVNSLLTEPKMFLCACVRSAQKSSRSSPLATVSLFLVQPEDSVIGKIKSITIEDKICAHTHTHTHTPDRCFLTHHTSLLDILLSRNGIGPSFNVSPGDF